MYPGHAGSNAQSLHGNARHHCPKLGQSAVLSAVEAKEIRILMQRPVAQLHFTEARTGAADGAMLTPKATRSEM